MQNWSMPAQVHGLRGQCLHSHCCAGPLENVGATIPHKVAHSGMAFFGRELVSQFTAESNGSSLPLEQTITNLRVTEICP